MGSQGTKRNTCFLSCNCCYPLLQDPTIWQNAYQLLIGSVFTQLLALLRFNSPLSLLLRKRGHIHPQMMAALLKCHLLVVAVFTLLKSRVLHRSCVRNLRKMSCWEGLCCQHKLPFWDFCQSVRKTVPDEMQDKYFKIVSHPLGMPGLCGTAG